MRVTTSQSEETQLSIKGLINHRYVQLKKKKITKLYIWPSFVY